MHVITQILTITVTSSDFLRLQQQFLQWLLKPI